MVSPASKLSSSVSPASYENIVLHNGNLGLGAGLGLFGAGGLGRAADFFDVVTLCTLYGKKR